MAETHIHDQGVDNQISRVALFDIDGTLIDHDYTVTDSGIYTAIHDAQNEGWTIGLSSDTPFQRMAQWRERFGMNGPLIVERGEGVSIDASKVEQVREGSNCFNDVVAVLAREFESAGIEVKIGDSVELLDQVEASDASAVVILDTMRFFSAAFFARSRQLDGTYVPDEELTDYLAYIARQHMPDNIEIDEDINHEHGLYIATLDGIHKRNGTAHLISQLGVSKLAMVGDSFSDYLGEDVAFHCAVGNASEDLKQRANFVALSTITTGAIESIEHLVEQY